MPLRTAHGIEGWFWIRSQDRVRQSSRPRKPVGGREQSSSILITATSLSAVGKLTRESRRSTNRPEHSSRTVRARTIPHLQKGRGGDEPQQIAKVAKAKSCTPRR